MILDKLENAHLYAKISDGLAKAFKVLKDKSILDRPDGRYELDGDKLFCIVQRYKTRPPEQGNLEAHRKYIDVQFIVSGEEIINHVLLNDLKVREAYDETKDRILYEPPKKMNPLRHEKGMFGVFFPQDAHMACLQVAGPTDVHKVVVKVRIDTK